MKSIINVGEFVTGNIDFFTISTIIPVDSTNIKLDLSTFLKQNGVSSYNNVPNRNKPFPTKEEYELALVRQENLNRIIRLISTRTAPIMLSIEFDNYANVNDGIVAGSTFTTFGTNFTSGTVYHIKFAIEHKNALKDQDFLASLLDGLIILNYQNLLAEPKISVSNNETRNLVVLKTEFL